MKKIKPIYYLLILLIIFFLIFYAWIEYQQSTRKVIDVDDITNIKISLDENKNPSKAIVKGEVKLDKFEKISTISAIQKEDIIYVYLTKLKGKTGKNNFTQSIGDILLTYSGGNVKKIALVSGDDIIVIDKEDSTRNYMEVSNYDKIEYIWSIDEE